MHILAANNQLNHLDQLSAKESSSIHSYNFLKGNYWMQKENRKRCEIKKEQIKLKGRWLLNSYFKTVPLYITHRHHIVCATENYDSVWYKTKVCFAWGDTVYSHISSAIVHHAKWHVKHSEPMKGCSIQTAIETRRSSQHFNNKCSRINGPMQRTLAHLVQNYRVSVVTNPSLVCTPA